MRRFGIYLSLGFTAELCPVVQICMLIYDDQYQYQCLQASYVYDFDLIGERIP